MTNLYFAWWYEVEVEILYIYLILKLYNFENILK